MARRLVSASVEEKKKYLLPLGDVHYGHPNSDREAFEDYLRWAEEEDAWIILMGDLIENSTKRSVGAGVYEQIMRPDQQIDEILTLLEPYRDRILGLLTGNHEERTFKDSGVDPSKYMARVLQVPYLRYAAFLRLVVGDHGWTVYATHGSSGASTPTGKINAVRKLAAVADADIYLMGHMHDLLNQVVMRRSLNTRNKFIESKRKNFIVTGNFLTYEDSYGEMKCYEPARVGAPRIRLSHDVHVSL